MHRAKAISYKTASGNQAFNGKIDRYKSTILKVTKPQAVIRPSTMINRRLKLMEFQLQNRKR